MCASGCPSEGHFAHHVGDLVDGLDLAAFYAPYELRMMVKVLLHGYATGVFLVAGDGIAHFRCPGPRVHPRIESGPFIRPRS